MPQNRAKSGANYPPFTNIGKGVTIAFTYGYLKDQRYTFLKYKLERFLYGTIRH